jgi:hypothetical protein
VDAGAEAAESDFWSGIHSAKARHDHLFVDFAAMIAAVFSWADEDCGGDAEALGQAADLPYIEFAFAGENF